MKKRFFGAAMALLMLAALLPAQRTRKPAAWP